MTESVSARSLAPWRLSARYRAVWLSSPAPSRSGALGEAVWTAALDRLIHLPAAESGGMFLANGGRLWLEDGQLVVETPECRSPSLALLYLRSAEQTLVELARVIGEAAKVPTGLARVGGSWVETILLAEPADPWWRSIVPYTVSRVVLDGQGGFDRSIGPLRFVLSTRATGSTLRLPELVRAERPARIRLSSRGEPGCRLRIRAVDSLGADSAAVLSLGASQLVAHLAADGRLDSAGVTPRRPLAAWRAFAADPACRAETPVEGGGTRTAIAIQRHYQAAVARRLGELPDWAGELSVRWGEALDRLESGRPPEWLEWPARLDGYERLIRSEAAWRDLAVWNERWGAVVKESGADRAGGDLAAVEDAIVRWAGSQGGRADGAVAYQRVRRAIAEREEEFDRVHRRAASEIEPGLALGSLFSVEQLDRASMSGPTDTRASVRSKWVRRLGATDQRSRFRADWHGVWDLVAGTWIDLTDPNVTRADWRPIEGSGGQGDLFAGLRDWLAGL